MKRLIAAVLTFIALQALPFRALAFEEAVPEAGESFYHNVVFRNFSNFNKNKVLRALDYIVEVVESEEFREIVLNFKDNQGNTAFLENNKLTNEQIYAKILEGAETLRPTPDRTMDMDITWYYAWNSTVGYTYPNSGRIWVNSRFYSKYDEAAISRNIFHEWTHKLGFGHVSGTKFRPWTVPYGLGAKMEALVRKRMQQNLY